MDEKTSYFTPVEATAFGIEQMARHIFTLVESLERLAAGVRVNPETASERTLALIQSADSFLIVVPRMAERIRESLEPYIEMEDRTIRTARMSLAHRIASETRELV